MSHVLPTTTAATAPVGTGLIKSLVGIRGVLAWIVVLVHLCPSGIALTPVGEPVWRFVWHHSYWALDLFFVLSGFVVTTGYRDKFAHWPGRRVYGRFLWARLSRFYPVHVVVLAAMVAAVLVAGAVGVDLHHGGNLGWDLVRHLSLTQGWGGAHALTWNGPTWSVSAEWLCYLLMPACVALVLRFRRPVWVVAAYLAAMAVPLTAYAVIGYGDAEITYIAPLWRAVGEFVGGAFLCQLRHVGSRIPGALGRHVGLLMAVTVAWLAVLCLIDASLLFSVPVAGLIVLALSGEHGAINRLLGRRILITWGELSVSLFLTHVPWLMAAALFVTPERFPGAWGWLGIVLMVAGAVVVAVVTHRLIDVPGQRLMARLARRGRGTPPPRTLSGPSPRAAT